MGSTEIVFFDLETTIPTRPRQRYALLEFGSILICPQKLTELESYDTLVRPLDLSLITPSSVKVNGITANHVVSCPTFAEIADKVYNILHGRIWAGHNILWFNCVRLKEAYEQINRPPPVPKGIIDTLILLSQRFGRRAGNMQMASLVTHFGLGQQSHRCLDDVRMNFEVVKRCATVLFLESSPQDTENNCDSLNASTINSSNRNSTINHTLPPNLQNLVKSVNPRPDPFPTGASADQMETEIIQSNEAFSNHTEFIDPDSVSMASITVNVAPFINGPNKIRILHGDTPLQIHCDGLRILFGLSTLFVDHVGNPRLSFLVGSSSSNLCHILDACDDISKRFVESDGNSQWRHVVTRNTGFFNSPTIRLHLPTVAEDSTRWITEIYYKNSSSVP